MKPMHCFNYPGKKIKNRIRFDLNHLEMFGWSLKWKTISIKFSRNWLEILWLNDTSMKNRKENLLSFILTIRLIDTLMKKIIKSFVSINQIDPEQKCSSFTNQIKERRKPMIFIDHSMLFWQICGCVLSISR